MDARDGNLCSKHFVDSDFKNKLQFDMGLASKLRLNKDAVPSVYPELEVGIKQHRPPPVTTTTVSTVKMRPAFRKREAQRVRLCYCYIYMSVS